LNLKIILINKFFEINFLKTFLCSKKNLKVPKKNNLHYISFVRLSIRYTCTFWWNDGQRASGHLKLNFSKSCHIYILLLVPSTISNHFLIQAIWVTQVPQHDLSIIREDQ
jgi:hypothetical protein